jgi:uncharacterized membrane protein
LRDIGRARQTWIGARVLLLAIGTAPLSVPLLERCSYSLAFGEILRALYGLQCHQLGTRSLRLLDIPFPVCSRCLGVYLGLAAAALVARPRWRTDLYKAWIVIGVSLMLLDLATEWVGLRPVSAALRFGTGVLLAYAIGLSISEALRPRRMPSHPAHRD